MRLTLLIFCICLSVNTHSKARQYGNATVSEIVSIYDGDTFTVNIASWPDIVGQRISIRVAGIDTPEMRGRCDEEKNRARLAKKFTVAALRNAGHVELRNVQRDKYFRVLSDVYIDGENLAQLLLNEGLAVSYVGNTKVNWCKN